MKKIMIKIVILAVIFVLGVAGFSSLMNSQNTDNKTDLQTASIPCMAMKIGDTEVNRMYGYAEEMQTDFMRDTLTPLGTDKTLSVSITPYGKEIQSLAYEIRTSDGSKVIENNKIKNFQEEADGKQTAQFTIQNSILMNQEYSLAFTLETEEGSWHYYTRILQRAGLSTEQYVAFVNSFYTKTFVKDSSGDLNTYLESDDTAANNSFYDLNIHSSLDMVTWGSLAPEISRPGIPAIKDINENTGSIGLTYYITAENEQGEVERYQVDEYYRMRYDQTRVRLLDFDRSVKQVLTTEQDIVSENGLNLGVTSRDVEYQSDSEGKILAFVQQGDLWAYNLETNKLTRVFSFRDVGSNDERNDYDQHEIDIVRVSKNGDIDFVVYGYMNRGEHEGCVGTAVYHYIQEQNVMEELFFLSSTKSFGFLKEEIEDFSYVSEDGNFYLLSEDNLYQIHMEDKTYTVLQEQVKEECFQVSENRRYVAWESGMESGSTTEIVLMDLETAEQQKITAGSQERLRLFGFMNDDVVYGVAKEGDIQQNSSGQTAFAMSEIRIQDHNGEVKKTYQQEGYYIMDVVFQDNLLELVRAQKKGDTYETVSSSQILNNSQDVQSEKFSVITTATVRQAAVTGLQFTGGSSQEPLVMEAKFMESGKDNVLKMDTEESQKEEYYVYAGGNLWGIYESPAEAVKIADEQAGIVLDSRQRYLWERSNTKEKASISTTDIPDAVKKGTLDLEQLRKEVQASGSIVDLTGCTLEQVLYQISAQRPVIVKGEGGQAKVIIGFDGYNTILYDPATQQTAPMGMQDSTKAFEENGNVFLCYIENIAE